MAHRAELVVGAWMEEVEVEAESESAAAAAAEVS